MNEDLNVVGYRYNVILSVFFIFYLACVQCSLVLIILLMPTKCRDSEQHYPQKCWAPMVLYVRISN